MERFNKCLDYLVAAPAVSERRPLFLYADDLYHVLVGRVSGHQVVVRQLVVLHNACRGKRISRFLQTCTWGRWFVVLLTSRDAPSSHLPNDESKTIHVRQDEGLEVAPV